jgi:uncharacterized membrane protein YfcA
MEYVVICIVALLGSGLTLFSGFGLGTLLVPVFALFFPIEVAISLTAIVHFLNNIFKLFLLGKKADKKILFQFGVPSVIAAFFGAYVLYLLSDVQPIFMYHLFGHEWIIAPVKLIIALLLLFFALFELLPKLKNWQVSERYLTAGGFLSGFFGGLSGNQGALRSAFLIKTAISKESYIATGVAIACITDVARLMVYSRTNLEFISNDNYALMASATLAAFAGAYIGNKLIKKITIDAVQVIVAVMLMVFAVLLGMGII